MMNEVIEWNNICAIASYTNNILVFWSTEFQRVISPFKELYANRQFLRMNNFAIALRFNQYAIRVK